MMDGFCHLEKPVFSVRGKKMPPWTPRPTMISPAEMMVAVVFVEMQKVADIVADISVLFFQGGANFWVIHGSRNY